MGWRIAMEQLTSPEPLSEVHSLNNFDCNEVTLNDWLQKRALRNQVSGASRIFVVCNAEREVRAYYCLSAGAIAHYEAPKNLRRNMPNPLPVVVLGRLAIDQKVQGKGLGSALLKDALLRVVQVSLETGVFAVLVHALSDSAKKFYLSRGFVESPIQPMTLFMTVKTIRSLLYE